MIMVTKICLNVKKKKKKTLEKKEKHIRGRKVVNRKECLLVVNDE